mgnify:CR=1 FL=1
MKFIELLEMQKQLDETVEKPRDNGFKPKRRTYQKIVKSMIAEIIEFNEETRDTHKTWKQKEFNVIKMVEESVDILFFYLQLVNFLGKEDERIIEILNMAWEECWKEVDEYRDTVVDIELELIKNLSDMEWCLALPKCLNIMGLLVNLYVNSDIFRETVEHTYKEKWQKNMERINGDWSL